MGLIDEKKNEWIYNSLDNFRKYEVVCPHCGAQYIGDYDQFCEPVDFNYCPHCGKICNPANLEWEKELAERKRTTGEEIGNAANEALMPII